MTGVAAALLCCCENDTQETCDTLPSAVDVTWTGSFQITVACGGCPANCETSGVLTYTTASGVALLSIIAPGVCTYSANETSTEEILLTYGCSPPFAFCPLPALTSFGFMTKRVRLQYTGLNGWRARMSFEGPASFGGVVSDDLGVYGPFTSAIYQGPGVGVIDPRGTYSYVSGSFVIPDGSDCVTNVESFGTMTVS